MFRADKHKKKRIEGQGPGPLYLGYVTATTTLNHTFICHNCFCFTYRQVPDAVLRQCVRRRQDHQRLRLLPPVSHLHLTPDVSRQRPILREYHKKNYALTVQLTVSRVGLSPISNYIPEYAARLWSCRGSARAFRQSRGGCNGPILLLKESFNREGRGMLILTMEL